MKPGFLTSEFVLCALVIVGIFVLAFTGKIAQLQDALALIGPALAATGYAVGRSNVKAADIASTTSAG